MTEGAAPSVLLSEHTLPPDDDPLFGFDTKEWYDPLLFEMNPPETDSERYRRLADETTYRSTTSPTHWFKYAILARHTVEGTWFDDILKEFSNDPATFHHLIWYNFMYHVDRKIDIPERLQAWAMSISYPFLTVLYPEALKLDTTTTLWKQFLAKINPWQKIGSNNKPMNPYKRKKASAPPLQNAINKPAIPPHTAHKPSLIQHTILEETDHTVAMEDSTKTPNTNNNDANRSVASKSFASSKDGKQSALVPNNNIPLNDGTHRVTFRMKMSFDTKHIDKQSADTTQTIYNFLKTILPEDDGMLYNWHSEGLENPKAISKLTPSEVRSFLPSLIMSPTQSLMVIPIRFGFNYKNPTIWRNRTDTKNLLDLNHATASISKKHRWKKCRGWIYSFKGSQSHSPS